MTPELAQKLERFLPIRVVVRIEDGAIEGRVEHSFSMGWERKCINIFWSGNAYSMLGEHKLDGVSWAEQNVNSYNPKEFVIDPLAEDSPVEIDWESWLSATTKFDKRNAPFKVKPGGAYQLRALAAERELEEIKPQLKIAREQRDAAEDKLDKIEAMLHPQTNTNEEE